MICRISIHDFLADPADTLALAREHDSVEIYDDEGDCVLTVAKPQRGRSYNCDGCHQSWQGAELDGYNQVTLILQGLLDRSPA